MEWWLYYSSTCFSFQIYHASEEFGPEDIQTSGGYFHMANVFFRQGKMDVADTLYRQVSYHSSEDAPIFAAVMYKYNISK